MKHKCKVKSSATATAPVVRKTSVKQGRGGKSIRSEMRTSPQDLALAKPLKCSMKFAAKSSRLSATEKASFVGVDSAR
jgi:hypothetical protein